MIRKSLLVLIWLATVGVRLEGQAAQYLYIAEPEAIQGFSINPVTGSLVSVGSPTIDAGGPVALAADSTELFVANNTNSVSAYLISTSGTLQEVPGSPFTAGDSSQPGAISLSSDNKTLFVASGLANANSNSGIVDSFQINPDNTLTFTGSVLGTLAPVGIYVISNFVYVAGGATVQGYTITEAGLVAMAPFPLSSGNVTAIASDGTFLYVGRTPAASSNGFIDSLAIANDGSLALVATYNAGVFNSVNNLALAQGYLYSNVNTFAILNGVLTPTNLNWINAPAAPLAASATAPFLFEGSEPQYTNLVYPLVIASDSSVTNSEPPRALSGTPISLAVVTGTTAPVSAPAFVFEPSTVNYQPVPVGQNATVQITIYSTGSVPLAINSLVISGDNSFSEQSSTCPSSLAPAQTCFVYVEFAPGGASSFTGVLTLDGNVNGTVALSGTGTAAPPSPPNPPTPTPASVNVAPSAQSGTPGSQFSYAVSTTGFSGTPQISATCSIPMGSCAMNGSTLIVTTTAPSTAAAPSIRWLLPLGLCAAALFCFPRRRRKTVLCVGALAILAACGGTGSKLAAVPPTVTAGTPAGTYAVQLSAASGSTKATATAQLVIQ